MSDGPPAPAAGGGLEAGLAALLAPFRRDPAAAAVICDFDGTLSPIAAEAAAASPAAGAVELLHRLAARYRTVAVVSGRPASFLAEHLEIGSHPPGLLSVGLYGLEEVGAGGTVTSLPGAEEWRPAVEEAASRAEQELPPEVAVERKGLSVTLHWRPEPQLAGVIREFAARAAADLGLDVRPARMSVELTPPLPVDKGTAVERLCAGAGAAVYVGDDVGDLPALRALDHLAATTGATTLRVAVGGDEVPAELLAAADLVVDGVAGAMALLAELDRP